MKDIRLPLGILGGYIVSSAALFLYSYTQVDLNLTLSRAGFWQTIQKTFQQIGYFQRPLSGAIYVVILISLFCLYGTTLWYSYRKKITYRQVWILIFLVAAILVFSYPAFSYDMFNYMFTAKTVLVYQKNPYSVIPLDFTGIDPWLTFMRWTHLPSAYTPLWIALTLPAYIFGFGYFLLTLWNIKLLICMFYLGTTWLIGEALKKVDPKHAAVGMVIFALNPLILVESLVSSHNDIVMMFFVMLAYLFYLQKNAVSSFFMLAVSIASKLMTFFLLPLYLLGWNRKYAFGFMFLGFVLVLFQREVLPWYFVWVMPFIALLPSMRWLATVAAGVSLGLLLRYLPYLYLGHWDDPAPLMKLWLTWIPIGVAILVIGVKHSVFKKIKN